MEDSGNVERPSDPAFWRTPVISMFVEMVAVAHMRKNRGHRIVWWFCPQDCNPPCNTTAAECWDCGWRGANKNGVILT